MENMKNYSRVDDDGKLRELLRASRPAPGLSPLGFRESVWRRIQRSEAAGEQSASLGWLDRIAEWLVCPRFALTGATIVVLVGGFVGLLEGSAEAKSAARDRYLTAVSFYHVD